MGKTLEEILSRLDGYLMSISRNIETGMYELEVGFRKNWVFKATDDVECDVTLESDSGSMVTISGKHDEVSVDDLVDYVGRVIETNKRITDMQEKFEEQLEEQKKKIEDQIISFEDEIEDFKNKSLAGIEEEEEEAAKKSKKSKKNSLKDSGEEFIEDDELAQKIS